jgi:hypothetical protein
MSACASNQDLVNLEEVDDIYYQSAPNGNGQLALVSLDNNKPNLMEGASDAEKSYYQQTPYNPPAESWEYVEESDSDEDYYDEDYARRLENFHSDEKKPQYIYADNDVYEIVDNTVPQVNWNVGFGYSNFGYGPGMNWGMGMGTGWGMGFGSMYMNPYGWNNCYGFGMNPYVYSSPFWGPNFYNPYYGGFYGGYYGNPYGMGFANGYNSGYYNGFYDGIYGYGNPYIAYNDRGGRQVVNEQRPTSTTSTRINRGGVVNPPSSDGGGRPSGIAQQPMNKQTTDQTASSNQRLKMVGNSGNDTSGEGATSGRNLRPKSTSSYYRQTANRQTRNAVSPYERAQKYAPTRSTSTTRTTRTTRSTYTPNRTNSTRYTPQNNNVGSRSRNTPSFSPSRSVGGSRGTTSPSSSPSRPSSPTRGGRR